MLFCGLRGLVLLPRGTLGACRRRRRAAPPASPPIHLLSLPPPTLPRAQDLVAEGLLALQRAARGYRADRGARFGTYAAAAVWKAMHRAVTTQARVVRLPAHHHSGEWRTAAAGSRGVAGNQGALAAAACTTAGQRSPALPPPSTPGPCLVHPNSPPAGAGMRAVGAASRELELELGGQQPSVEQIAQRCGFTVE